MKRLWPGFCVPYGAGQQLVRQRPLRRHCYDKLWNCWIRCSNHEQHSQLSAGPNRWGMISSFTTRAICFLSTRVKCAGAFHLWQASISKGTRTGIMQLFWGAKRCTYPPERKNINITQTLLCIYLIKFTALVWHFSHGIFFFSHF